MRAGTYAEDGEIKVQVKQVRSKQPHCLVNYALTEGGHTCP